MVKGKEVKSLKTRHRSKLTEVKVKENSQQSNAGQAGTGPGNKVMEGPKVKSDIRSALLNMKVVKYDTPYYGADAIDMSGKKRSKFNNSRKMSFKRNNDIFMQRSTVQTSSATHKILGKPDVIHVRRTVNHSIINDIQQSISSPYNRKHVYGKSISLHKYNN